MSVGLCQSAAKGKGKGKKNQKIQRTKIKTKKQKAKKNILMKVTKIGFLGVSNFVFLVFCFFSFLVSCFLVRCWFFEGLAKQHKSEGPRPHSLPVLPL